MRVVLSIRVGALIAQAPAVWADRLVVGEQQLAALVRQVVPLGVEAVPERDRYLPALLWVGEAGSDFGSIRAVDSRARARFAT